MILGTAAYMAPEQARGRPVDHRADIWAFGVVVYEMLTGRRLFSGETVSDTMAQVLTKDPDLDAVPRRLRRLLRACLAREPGERLRDIGDAMLLVDEDDGIAAGGAIEDAGAARESAAFAGRLIGAGGWMLATAALVAGGFVGAVVLRPVPAITPPASVRPFEPPPAGGRFLGAPLPSPDGRHLGMVVLERGSRRRIWVRSLTDDTARPLDGTEGVRLMRWSPDSEELVCPVRGSLTRNLAALSPRRDPERLRSYLEACAIHTAQVVDQSTLRRAAGIAKATSETHEELLRRLFVIDQIPAWWTNRLKRLVRSPKRYFVDPGLAMASIRIDLQGLMRDGHLLGQVLETFVLAQLRADLPRCESRPRLFHLRQGQERHQVDLVAEYGGGRILGLEVKATASPGAREARHLVWLREQLGERFLGGLLLHTGRRAFRLEERVIAAPIAILWS